MSGPSLIALGLNENITFGRCSDYTPSSARNGGGSDVPSARKPGLDFDTDSLFKDREGELIIHWM